MLEIIDKTVIFICCAGIYLLEPAQGLWIVPLILVLTLSSLGSYFEKSLFHPLSFIIYCILCSFWSNLLFFLPLIFYDVVSSKLRPFYLFAMIPIVTNRIYLSPTAFFSIISFFALAWLLKLRTLSTNKLKQEHIRLSDDASEISRLLEEQNAALIENQDHEIHVATLSERNRIAREIHDNLGHILSRCLLQIGAMLAVNKDSMLKEMLLSLKENLSQGMDSIRKSIHNLHDESIDLKHEVDSLIRGFTFCPVRLSYDMGESLDKKLKYAFISIVKEALSNVIKHSNATEVSLTLREHPGFYQLVIQDNGVIESYNTEKGIGIKNIQDRVAAFNGHTTINTSTGFKIFISIPKEVLK